MFDFFKNVLSDEWQLPWRQLLWRIAGLFIVITYKKGNVQEILLYWFLFLKDTESYHSLAPNTIASS